MISESLRLQSAHAFEGTLPDVASCVRTVYTQGQYLNSIPEETTVWFGVKCRIVPAGKTNFYNTGVRTEQYDYTISLPAQTDVKENDVITVIQRDNTVIVARVGLVDRTALNILKKAFMIEVQDPNA